MYLVTLGLKRKEAQLEILIPQKKKKILLLDFHGVFTQEMKNQY